MATSRVPQALTESEVRSRMMDKIARSKLDTRDANKLGFKPMTALGARTLGLPISKAGFKIPYFTPRGSPMGFFRFRYLEDTRSGFAQAAGTKEMRYAQPKNSEVAIYLPPNSTIPWTEIFADPTLPIVITEGELKAACACKFSIPTIGLGGVWSFQSAKNGVAFLEALEEVDWADRSVYICYDSDGATNPQVVEAENRLAKRLLERGANVHICRLPPLPADEPDGAPYKCGIDDYILVYGVEAFKTEILDNAFEYEASAALHEMSERVVYVRNPGFIWDYEARMKLAPSAFREHAFSNRHYFETRVNSQGKETLVKTPTAKAWLDWAHRSECRSLAFEPGQPRITEGGDLNMWMGWGLGEDAAPMQGDISEWDRLMSHIFGGDTGARRYFEQWAAYPLQHPGTKMHVAVAIWGPVHGSGKTLIGTTLRRIYGDRHSEELKDSSLEDDRFEWAENKQFILADDITSRGDRKFMRKLMTMITQSRLRLNIKYVASYSIRDVINYMFTSNDPDALFMDDQDRRFFVHEVLAGLFPNHLRYVEWMNSASGIAALWYHLMNIDMTGFDPHAPAPATLGKASMIEMGKSELGAWVHELKQNTEIVLTRAKIRGDLVSAKQLHSVFDPGGDKRASVNALARELKRAGFRNPANGVKLKLSDGQQVTVYAMREREKWIRASWRDACDHYEANNPQLVSPAPRKKF